MKKAVITGVCGQDGSYLAEYLLKLGYEVYGIVRNSTMMDSVKMENIESIKEKIKLIPCSLENGLSVYKMIDRIRPDECYHLAATSFVSYSLEDDLSIMVNNFTTTHNLLAALLEVCPNCKFYFAGSSEIFGEAEYHPQNERTAYNPRSIYGISKLSSYHLVKNYREKYGMFACTGFAYNHESPRRGRIFVTRKITYSVACITLGLKTGFELGNICAARDWGYAPEYIQAMYCMLNQNKEPKDYVIATGILHTVEELLKVAFDVVGLDYKKYIKIKNDLVRPSETIPLVGDATNIYKDLGWKASKNFEDLICEMVENDINILKKVK